MDNSAKSRGCLAVNWKGTRSTVFARSGRLIAVVAVIVAMLGFANRVLAQRTVERVGDYTITSWSQSDDVPVHVEAMAQTADGWLWLASRSHLYRFDGVSSELYNVPNEDGSNLVRILATDSGDLWLGYVTGTTLVIHGGDFSHSQLVKGFVGQPTQFVQDGEGNVWGSSLNHLFEASPSRWQFVDQHRGILGRYFYTIALDTQKTLWVFTDQGLFSLDPGQTSFRQRTDITHGLDWRTLVNADDIPAHVHAYAQMYFLSVLALAGRHVVPMYSSSQYFAGPGAAGLCWIALSTGTYKGRYLTAGELKTFANDLPGAMAANPADFAKFAAGASGMIFEDRQHNIWSGAKSGLNRFRPSVVKTIDVPDEVTAFAMLPDESGGVWFGNALAVDLYGWWHVDKQVVTTFPGYDLDTTSVYRDTDGSILIGTGDGYIRRFDGKGFQPMEPLPPDAEKGDDITAMARDGEGRLWVAIRNHPLYVKRDGAWVANGGFKELPNVGLLRAITDANGRLWLSYARELFVIDGSHIQRYAQEAGMHVLNVRDIIPNGTPLIGGDSGLAAFDGSRFHDLLALDPTVLTGITGMVREADGTLWINGFKGGVRISAEELKRSMADPNYKMSVRSYGTNEGMPGIAQMNRPVPTLIQGTDGRLWFATTQGIAWLDPAKVPMDKSAPVAVVRSMKVANNTFRPEAKVNLPAGSRAFEMDYTALGLMDPTKARFRYQLVGVDSDWQDVGTRRQAFYTNVGPGTYRFRVAASNEDGAWSTSDASIQVSIAPYFYQTKWFLAVCFGLLLFVLWLAYIYHLKQVTRRLHQRLEERHAERDRIARELHDTFLQTVQALVLKIHAASSKLPEGEARDSIASALDLADDAIAEGRDRVRALRAPTKGKLDLAAAFAQVGREYEGDHLPRLKVVSSGTVRSPDPLVMDELYASGREAIINALNHSGATVVDVAVRFDRAGIRIEVADNGKGIDQKVLSDGGKQGHWGLCGIKERMDRIGGECRIVSDAEGGTTVLLFVRALRA
jgi:signal transduction histidine kinase/ligand-binding sensor domain-containing protein